ncbi:unnamed protein product [Arabis nemorensis]|uniref:Putative plant transposon protein domain-containing protein n=1 Tax=Arabis nemorensis TaxID=586526 RepID=A0A565AX75_9BRAS|nr:unnamed protein product [Arabis nemorensis]
MLVSKFYSNLGNAPPDVDREGVFVFVRGEFVEFSPRCITRFFGRPELTLAEAEAADRAKRVTMPTIAKYLRGRSTKTDSVLTTAELPPKYAALATLACYNWIPTHHKVHVAKERARLIYNMCHQVPVDFGKLVYDQVMKLKSDSDSLINPKFYHKDVRSGRKALNHEKIGTKAGAKIKEVASSKKRVQNVESQPEPRKRVKSAPPASSYAPTTPAATINVSLGHISVPQGHSSQRVVNKALYQTQGFCINCLE